MTGRTNKTQLILQKIREHTFTTFTVIVSANETFSKFIADSLRQSKIRKIVFLCSKNKENYQPIGNVENLISVKTVNIKFGLFPTYILNAFGKISDVLNSLSASSFRRRVVPKNVSTIFANSIREEGGFENVELKMFYQAKEKKLCGEYTINRTGNEKLKWYSNTTLWNETFYHSKNCLAGFYPIYKGADKCRWSCVLCESGYYKNFTGQGECRMCNRSTSVTNVNRTKCLPFAYQYYQVNGNYKSIVQLLATVGISVFIIIFGNICKISEYSYRKIIQYSSHFRSNSSSCWPKLSVTFDADETKSHCLFTSFSYVWKCFEINYSNMDD